jgi:hypothetical protein
MNFDIPFLRLLVFESIIHSLMVFYYLSVEPLTHFSNVLDR